MTATTTRTRASRGADQRRGAPPPRGGYGSYVDGANALQVDAADVAVDERAAPPWELPADPRESSTQSGPVRAVSRSRAPFVALIVAVVTLGVLGVLVLNTKINENSFQIDNLRGQQAQLDRQEQQLNARLADLESTGNLNAEAARLGLVPAGAPAFLHLPDGRVVGVPQPATGPDPGR